MSNCIQNRALWTHVKLYTFMLPPVPTRPGGGRGKRYYKLPGPNSIAYGFCLSRYYHYLSILQISLFRPSPSHSATDSQSFRSGTKVFSQFTLAVVGGEGGGNKYTGARTRSRRLWHPHWKPLHSLFFFFDVATVLL